MYNFKTYLSTIVTELITNRPEYVKIYLSKYLAIIEIMGFQFSFKHMPKNGITRTFETSLENIEVVWCKKIQPLSPLLLHYSRLLKKNQGIVIT